MLHYKTRKLLQRTVNIDMEVLLKFIFLLFLLIIFQQNQICAENSFTTKITSITCKTFVDYVIDVKCDLKPIRNGMGTLYLQGRFTKPVNDFWVKAQLFYKFGTIYRQWLISFDFNICEGLRHPPKTLIERIAIDRWKKKVSKDFQSCPFLGLVSAEFNADNSSTNIYYDQFPRMPDGDYKINYFLHTTKNEAIYEAILKFQVVIVSYRRAIKLCFLVREINRCFYPI